MSHSRHLVTHSIRDPNPGLVSVRGTVARPSGKASGLVAVTEGSESWRMAVERLLHACPNQDDLAYVAQVVARLKSEKFDEHSDTRATIRTAKAQRQSTLAKRRLKVRQ